MKGKSVMKTMKRKGTTLIELILKLAMFVIFSSMALGYFGVCRPQSRWKSRYGGEPLKLILPEDFVKMVGSPSIGSGGTKNVTYIDTDGNYRTQEYRDSGWFEGEILWVIPEKQEVLEE